MNETNAAIDLDAYFRRIGYAGDRSPTLETLRGIHLAHAKSIPFENLDPLLGKPVRLDASSLEEKLVRNRRGGYCFEHNLLLSHALRACGFQVTGLAARVVWNQPPEAMNPRTHMLLRVDIDGAPYLADVGFGGVTLTTPLRLAPGIEQATTHEPFRLREFGDALLMEALVRDAWVPLYRFDQTEQHQPDYEVANWFICTHPDSFFTFSLLAARPDADRRYGLRDNDFAVHHLGGPTERRTLTTPAELRRVLEESFLISLPADPNLDATLTRLTASAPPA